MFVIEKLFVDDKQLPKVLYALAGLVYKMEPPRPVTNVVAKNGKLKQASSAVSLRGQVIEQLAQRYKGTDITFGQVKDLMVQVGGSPKSAHSALMAQLMEQKVLKRKERGVYHVL